MLVNNMPRNILALPRAVIASKAPDALPSCSASAQTARPSTSCNSFLFQEPSRCAVQSDNWRDDYRSNRTEPPSSNNCCSNLPPDVRVSQSINDVWRHRFEPVFVVNLTGRWWRECVGGTTSFTVQTSACFRVTGATTPLLYTEVVDKCHGPRTFAR